ncbi:hypothetical protein DY000_02057704 [Brassica cretica]|uniref:Uncharacterized protein n=1 Tax=Brassica cretica TaxID=69181 RepID=A0ABQ7AAJ0_BRACR|nr:hypothetical protein DY000_02057704 [Brassica cretica]
MKDDGRMEIHRWFWSMSEIHRWFSLGLLVDLVALLVDSVALLFDSLWFLAVAIFEESRWLSSTDKICGSPRGWKSAVAADYNRKDERWFYFFSQKERRHRTANSSISLLAKGSRRNRSKLLERFILSSQERTSMLNQRLLTFTNTKFIGFYPFDVWKKFCSQTASSKIGCEC